MMNAVMQKDLFGLLRQRRSALATCAFAVALCIIVMATWPQRGLIALSNAGQDQLLIGLACTQLAAILLLVPGAGAVALSAERESGTLELLYASRLSSRDIVIGKILSVVGVPLFLMTIALPFVGLLYYRGGTDLKLIVSVYSILLATAGMISIVALTASAFCDRSSDAMAWSYTVVLALSLGALVPAEILLSQSSGLSAATLHYARSASPIAAILAVLRPGLSEFDGSVHGFISIAPVFVCVALSAIVICYLLLRFKLERRERPLRAKCGNVAATARWTRRFLFIIDPSAPRKPITSINPVCALEARVNPLRSGTWIMRVSYASLCVAFALALMALYGGTDQPDLLNYVMRVLLAFHVALIALLCPCLTTGSISYELQIGAWEFLRLSPLTPLSIFMGKLLSALLAGVTPIAAMLPAYAALCYLDPSYIPYLLRIMPILAAAVLLCCSVGLACSSTAANVSRATTTAYLIVIAISLAPALAQWSCAGWLNARETAWVGVPSALATALSIISLDQQSHFTEGFWRLHLVVTIAASAAALLVTWARISELLRHGQ